MTPDTAGVTRRRLLSTLTAVVGSVTVSGCSALWDQPGATDVVVHNAASGLKTVTVTITETGADEPHTSRTIALTGGETVDPVNRSKLPMNTAYSVEVTVTDGPRETFEWDDPRIELAPLYVLIDETQNVRFLLQAG